MIYVIVRLNKYSDKMKRKGKKVLYIWERLKSNKVLGSGVHTQLTSNLCTYVRKEFQSL